MLNDEGQIIMKKILISVIGCLMLSVALPLYGAMEPKFLVEEDPTLLTTVVNVVVQTGAADDGPTKSGLTNILAELMLRGTKKKDRTHFQSEVERLGASLDVNVSQDLIIFQGNVIQENTQKFLKLLEDALLHPAFSEKEFKALKTEVLAEISNKKNQNGRLAGLAIRRTMFANTVLEHQVDGGTSTIPGITLDDIQKAYNDRFHQGNIFFAISSPVKPDEVKGTLASVWRQFPDGLKVSRRSIPPQAPTKPLLIVVEKRNTSTGSIFQAQPGITAQDPDRYALMMGNEAFGGNIQICRLFKVIREEAGWTYAISSTYGATGGLTSQQGLFAIVYTPSMEFTAKALLKTLDMWRNYYESGLKKDELLASSESLINSYPFQFDTAGERLGQKIHSYLYNVPILTPEEYEKKLNSISNKDLLKAIKARQMENGWTIAIVADPKQVQKLLDAEQKNIPEADRLKIAKVITPEEVIQ